MTPLRIALLQLLPVGRDQEENRIKGEEACRIARERGADIALFPEMWNIGCHFFDEDRWDRRLSPDDPRQPEDVREWSRGAIDETSEFFQSFQRLACKLEMAIGLTYLQKWIGAPRNTLSLIDRTGQVVLTYAKVHTCAFSVEGACTPGEEFPVCDLETAQGAVKIGGMICYDREFPESARLLMLGGAEIIVTPNACELETNRLAQFRSRAFENMVGLAMTNYPAPYCNGHSIACTPMAFNRDETSRDMTIVEGGEEEGIFIAEFDLDELRDYRHRETWGNAYRRPMTYKALVDHEVREPFLREP